MLQNFSDLKGKTLTAATRVDDRIEFTLENGDIYCLYHCQDCCESVHLEDVIGDLDDLINSRIEMAEEVTQQGSDLDGVKLSDYRESFTWTFYKLATVKGYVTLRWYGESNGYYSESVDWGAVKKNRSIDRVW